MRGRCSRCQQPAPGYDRLAQRRWRHVPLWGISTCYYYARRRVECTEHGIVVEHIPWSEGKRPVTRAMMGFLGRWARRLSWRETAQVFQTSWEVIADHQRNLEGGRILVRMRLHANVSALFVRLSRLQYFLARRLGSRLCTSVRK